MSSNRIAADDNPMKLMSIAMKPLTSPPFTIEQIEELTRLMGGAGSMEFCVVISRPYGSIIIGKGDGCHVNWAFLNIDLD